MESEPQKLVFQSNLKEKRAEALRRRQEQVEKDKLEKEKRLSSQILTLFDDTEDSMSKESQMKIQLQEQLIDIKPEDFFKSGGVSNGHHPKEEPKSHFRSTTTAPGRDDKKMDDRYNRRGDDRRGDDRRGDDRRGDDRRDDRRGDDRYNRRGDDRRGDERRGDDRRGDGRQMKRYEEIDYRENMRGRDDYDLKRVSSSKEENEFGKREREREMEIRDIQSDYYGQKTGQPNQKKLKKSERNRFIFDWDSYDDTSSEYNSLYSNRTDYKPQFGRGHIAGFEEQEEEKRREKVETSELVTKHHWSKKSLSEMAERDWRIFKEDYNITTVGNNIPNPMRNWREGSLSKQIMDAVHKLGYEKPSPIQMQSIPISLKGRDILGIAETGSGKTAAFVIPMLMYIAKQPRLTKETELNGPYALVLAPTRELVQQIDRETKALALYYGFRSVALVGGLSIDDQAYQLSRGCEIVIATPGRLNDCLEKQYLVLNQCNYVVLDEADMMINFGFEKQVENILEAIPSSSLKSENEEVAARQEADSKHVYRTTILFSATMPPFVEHISRKYLRRACHIVIGEAGKAVDRIKQNVVFVRSENDKKEQLGVLLSQGPPPPIIIFVNKKIHCEIVAGVVEESGFSYSIFHAGKSQEQREAALDGFKRRRYNVLIATGVAARGIHVEGVTHVINFDMPNNIEDYTHRIGRTGRAGMEGLASSLMLDKDVEIMYDLKNMLTQSHNTVPPELAKHPASQQKHGANSLEKTKRSETVIYK